VQDILRFVPHVVVEAPESLRQLVLEHLEHGLAALRAEPRKPAAGEARFSAG
jgi:predicted DNA-binding transcriptional regulator YafY